MADYLRVSAELTISTCCLDTDADCCTTISLEHAQGLEVQQVFEMLQPDCQCVILSVDNFNDGRLYSLAALLKRDRDFSGSIYCMAQGLLPDQAYHAFNSGVDYLLFDQDQQGQAELCVKLSKPFVGAYQHLLHADS